MKKAFSFLRQWNFKRKLILFSLLISTIPVIMLGSLSAYTAGKSIQEETDRNHRIILRQVQYQIDSLLQGLDTFSLQLASDPIIQKSMEYGVSMDKLETLEATLDMSQRVRDYRSYNGALFNVSLIYNQYDQVYSNHYGVLKLEDYPFLEQVNGEQMQSNRSVILPPNSYPNQQDYLIMRQVTSNKTIRSIGRVILHVNPSLFYKAFESADLGNNRQLLVVDTQGKISISSNSEEIGLPITPIEEEVLVTSQRSDFNHWTYMAITPMKEATAKSDQIRSLTWFIVSCIVLLWILIAIFGSRKLYSPIQKLFARLSVGGSNGDLSALGDYIDDIVYHNTSLQERWNEQIPHLKAKTLLQLLRGELLGQEYDELAEQYSISLSGSYYYVFVLEIDNSIAFHQNFHTKDRTLITYAFTRLVEEIGLEMDNCEVVTPLPGQVVFLLGVERNDREGRNQIIRIGDMVRSKVNEHFNFTITAAVSDSVSSYEEIPSAYEQALQFQRYRPLIGHGITITSETLEHPTMLQDSIQSFIQYQKAVVASVSDRNMKLANENFLNMMAEAERYFISSESIISLLVFLLGDIEEAVRRNGFELGARMNDDMYRSLYAAQDIADARDWFIHKLFPEIEQASKQRVSSLSAKQDTLINQVIEYIHEHFEEDLSLQQLADHFGCSQYQLSRIFKETKQINFVEYLIRYRMEKAKEWLIHTDLPIKEITERLCYTSTQNFTRIFKQITGMPPGNYRNVYRDV